MTNGQDRITFLLCDLVWFLCDRTGMKRLGFRLRWLLESGRVLSSRTSVNGVKNTLLSRKRWEWNLDSIPSFVVGCRAS